MKYLSGIHALNLNCSLDTCGDWHTSALHWDRLIWRESNGSLWGDYGIEINPHIPENPGNYHVANHIRALLDLLYEKNFPVAQGMRNDYICNDKYTPEIFEKVSQLYGLPQWDEVDSFMGNEYKMEWVRFKEGDILGKRLA